MALIVPDSSVSLYRDIPITPGVQIAFTSRDEQTGYFRNHLITDRADCSYIRRTGRLRIEWPTNQVSQANYLSFRNPSFENRIFYARILDYEYVNNTTTDILYELDVWQTYCFDAKYGNGFVEREQLSEDVWNRAVSGVPSRACRYDYYMTSAEDLATGEGLEKIYDGSMLGDGDDVSYLPKISGANDSDTDLCMLLQIALPTQIDDNYTLDADADDASKVMFDMLTAADGFTDIYANYTLNVPTACVYLYFNMARNEISRLEKRGAIRFRRVLDLITINGLTGSITGLYAVPRYFVKGICNKEVTAVNESSLTVVSKDSDPANTSEVIAPPQYSGLHPKLDMYPYRYLRITAPDGASKGYNFERSASEDGSLLFTLFPYPIGVPKLSCAPVLYGESISGEFCSYNDRIDYSGVPAAPYATDNFLAFLSQQYNSAYNAFTVSDTVSDLLSTAGGIASTVAGMAPTRGQTTIHEDFNPSPGVTSLRTVTHTPGQSGSVSPMSAFAIPQMAERWASPMVTMAEGHAVRGNLDKANTSRFAVARSGNIGSNYVKGSGDFAQYIMDSASTSGGHTTAFRFRATKVDLRADIRAAYNDYLMTYGCTANRFGIPYVCNYVSGETNSAKLPKFVEHGGETFTYVRTSGLSVYGVEASHAAEISAMFDAGVRMLKGSEL